MDEVTKVLEYSLTKYFNGLSQKGYVSYNSVFNLILLSFLDKLLSDFKDYIEQQDYDIIIKTIQQLEQKECTIDYSKCTDTFFMKDNVY